MRISIHYIYALVLIILISIVAIEWHNNNALESRINSLNKNSVDFGSEKTFKEDYYITQQSHDTNLILVVFTILVGLGSFFTYVNILERYNSKLSEIQDEHRKQNDKWDSNHKKLVRLECELNFEMAQGIKEKAFNSLTDEKYDMVAFLSLSLCAMERFGVAFKKSDNEVFKKQIMIVITSMIESCHEITSIDNEIYTDEFIDINVYKGRINNITSLLDSESLNKFNQVISKIEIAV